MLVDAGSNLGLALLQLTRFFVVVVLRNPPDWSLPVPVLWKSRLDQKVSSTPPCSVQASATQYLNFALD
jgi:hypothetical protein